MLFVPWRDEATDLDDVNVVEKAQDNMDLIKSNSMYYYDSRETDDRSLREFINEIEASNYNTNEYEDVMNEMELLENDQYVTSSLTGARQKSTTAEKFLPPKLIDDGEYFKIMRSLNIKQRQIVLHILHCLKTGKGPFHIFLTGGAGVGKSHVVTAVVQSYLRFCNKLQSFSPEGINVLIKAPTGKAAFNVFGMTMHSTFKLPKINSVESYRN